MVYAVLNKYIMYTWTSLSPCHLWHCRRVTSHPRLPDAHSGKCRV